MDPASAIITFVVTTVQTIQLVKDTLDDIKSASDELASLQDRVEDVQLLLHVLGAKRPQDLFQHKADLDGLDRLRRRAQKCLSAIIAWTAKVQKRGHDGGCAVDKLKWLMKGKQLESLLRELGKLEKALNMMMSLANLRLQDATLREMSGAGSGMQTRSQQSYAAMTNEQPPPYSYPLLPTQELCCLEGCECCCHGGFSTQVIPSCLTPYIGRAHISRRLLHSLQLSSLKCNVQSCRRDKKKADVIKWYTPSSYILFNLNVQVSSLRFIIHTPRIVLEDAEVWKAIYWENLEGLRQLFRSGKASIYDATPYGLTVLRYACQHWQLSRTPESLNIVKFLADAGADPDFTVGSQRSTKEILFYLCLGVMLEHPDAIFAHQIPTSAIAIDVCRSALGINLMDIVAEYLDEHPDATRAALGFWPWHPSIPPKGAPSGLAVWRRFVSYAPLEYAAGFISPESVAGLLRAGQDARFGAPLAYAAWSNSPSVARMLLEADANVNAADRNGWTALHWAARLARVDVLELLLKFAREKISWDTRTPAGETALQLALQSPYLDELKPEERERLFTVLREHIVEENSVHEEFHDIVMPGAYPQ